MFQVCCAQLESFCNNISKISAELSINLGQRVLKRSNSLALFKFSGVSILIPNKSEHNIELCFSINILLNSFR